MLKFLRNLFHFGRGYGPCGGPRYAWPVDQELQVKLVAATVPRYLDAAAVDYELLKAVTQWRRACGVQLQHLPYHLPAKQHSHPEILVRFGAVPGRAWDGEGGNLAYAFYPVADDPREIHGDIFLDPSEPWTTSKPRFGLSVSVGNVLLHELGHAIGLEHSSDPADVMWPTYRAEGDRVASGDRRAALMRYPFSHVKPTP